MVKHNDFAELKCFVCFFGLRLYVQVNKFSVMSERRAENVLNTVCCITYIYLPKTNIAFSAKLLIQ